METANEHTQVIPNANCCISTYDGNNFLQEERRYKIMIIGYNNDQHCISYPDVKGIYT